jgi:hypothetical protein
MQRAPLPTWTRQRWRWWRALLRPAAVRQPPPPPHRPRRPARWRLTLPPRRHRLPPASRCAGAARWRCLPLQRRRPRRRTRCRRRRTQSPSRRPAGRRGRQALKGGGVLHRSGPESAHDLTHTAGWRHGPRPLPLAGRRWRRRPPRYGRRAHCVTRRAHRRSVCRVAQRLARRLAARRLGAPGRVVLGVATGQRSSAGGGRGSRTGAVKHVGGVGLQHGPSSSRPHAYHGAPWHALCS